MKNAGLAVVGLAVLVFIFGGDRTSADAAEALSDVTSGVDWFGVASGIFGLIIELIEDLFLVLVDVIDSFL